jgi:hypothetical protein
MILTPVRSVGSFLSSSVGRTMNLKLTTLAWPWVFALCLAPSIAAEPADDWQPSVL